MTTNFYPLTGFVRSTAVAIEGSTKCLFDEVRIAVLERIDGNQAGKSATTKILRNAFKYELIVLSEIEIFATHLDFHNKLILLDYI